MSFGRRKSIMDRYDQLIEVDVDEGDAEPMLSITAEVDLGGRTVRGRAVRIISAFTPDQADDLADQLHAAAAYARTRTPHE